MNWNWNLAPRPMTWIALALLALGAGCGGQDTDSAKDNPETNAAAGGSVLTAPVDYIGAIAKEKQSMEKSADLSLVNNAIQRFQVELGRFPKDLNELVQEKYLPRIPSAPYGSRLTYDPATGVASIVKQP